MTVRAAGVVLLVAAALAAPVARASEPVLVDGVAAVVDRRVITRSEVYAEGRMVLVNRAGGQGLKQRVDARFLDSMLDYLVVQELLVQEARRAGITVSEGDVDRRLEVFKGRFDDEGDFAAFLLETGVDEEAVRAVLRRDLAIEELVSRRLASVTIAEEDVRGYLDSHPEVRERLLPAAQLEVARQALDKERREAAFAALVTEVRARVEVRRVAAFVDETQPAHRVLEP